MGGECFVGAREAAEGRRGRVTRVDDVTVRDTIPFCWNPFKGRNPVQPASGFQRFAW